MCYDFLFNCPVKVTQYSNSFLHSAKTKILIQFSILNSESSPGLKTYQIIKLLVKRLEWKFWGSSSEKYKIIWRK